MTPREKDRERGEEGLRYNKKIEDRRLKTEDTRERGKQREKKEKSFNGDKRQKIRAKK